MCMPPLDSPANSSAATAVASTSNGLPPRPRNYCLTPCCPGYQRQQGWTAERIAHICSNVFILGGTLTALVFAIYAASEVTNEHLVLTVFIVGGTVFGGACLLGLVNVSWMARRPGVRISAIQVICNVVLFLITSYLELLFWPYPGIAYSILFLAGLPMLIMINLPTCFVKKTPEQMIFQDGDTICLDQDAMDDATLVDDVEAFKKEQMADNEDNTQRTTVMDNASLCDGEGDKMPKEEVVLHA
ncbi:expressed unknown protein [Seminavis robusta]|uniref:Uncharacterized protein n=1 Tax=Seminavis robusta TaxID=568900 RepID=A0A9N8EW04_9STRA|nr:expressed unknown protein [Seminavis robusta]|eukprot:Sro2189_g318240.1 n/a (244) ;mRNA; f:7006-7737